MVTIAVYLPDDGSLPQPLGEASARHALTHCIQHSGADRVQVVTVANVSQHIDVALQLIGESVRIAGSWATVNGQRMSSLVALWNRLDCYRQSLDAPDPQVFCASKAAALQATLGCSVESCAAPCQFLCRECTLIGIHPPTAIVQPETQVLALLGEIDWCPNLRRPPHL
ncbi:MAG: hypothetical protein JNM35_04180 [Nitrospira sp.]|nr:hypothetical protein [Nitrospira sp.]